MATAWYEIDPSYTIGEYPTGWVTTGDTDEVFVQTQLGEKTIRLTVGAYKVVSPPSSLAVAGVTEILCIASFGSVTGNFGRSGGPGAQVVSEFEGYWTGAFGEGSDARYRNRLVRTFGSTSDAALATGSDNFTPDTKYFISLVKNGTSYESRWWAIGDARPTTPQITATDSTYAVTLPCVFGRNGNFFLHGMGVGTDGDAAPTGPVVAGGTPVLSSPSASSITANSIIPNVTLTF